MKYTFYLMGTNYYRCQLHNRPSSYRTLSIGAKRAVIASRKRLGDVTKVANLTGFSVPYVSQVLNAQYTNKVIVNAAYDMTRGRTKNSLKNSSL